MALVNLAVHCRVGVFAQRSLSRYSFKTKFVQPCPTLIKKVTVKSFCTTTNTPTDPNPVTPPVNTTPPKHDLASLLKIYASLGKYKLGALVTVTTMAGFVMAPAPFALAPFILSSVGTSLAIASANTFNQVIEIEKDALMSRTWNRILPSGQISRLHAFNFGVVTGLAGTALLYFTVNPICAALALGNIILYAGVYTPLKQIHTLNTHVGSIVGAIPPMIGWCAATGGLEMGAWVMGLLLYVWQIPHFHALAWRLRSDYAKGGYKMLCTEAPEKVAPTALRWSLYTLPIGALCTYAGMTTPIFALDSLPLSGYLVYNAYNFYKDNSNMNARRLFFATLGFLPLFMLLMLFHKKDHQEEEKKQIEPVTQ